MLIFKGAGLVGVGVFAGVMSGLLGVGGGIVTVPMLIILFSVDPHRAVGTSLAAIVPTAIMAAFRHTQLGHVDWRLAGMVAAGAVVGALFGASATPYVSAPMLKKIFAVFMILTAIRMLMK